MVRNSVTIEVPPPRNTFQWRAIYQDGSTLNEYDEERQDGRGPAEALTKPLARLALICEETGVTHQMTVPAGATPVFFWRGRVSTNPDGAHLPQWRLQCIGWTRGEEGVYLFVFGDGSTLLTDDFQAL